MSGALAQRVIIPAFLLFDIVGRMAHVLFEHGQWRTTHGEDAITATPEYGLAPVIPSNSQYGQIRSCAGVVLPRKGWRFIFGRGKAGQKPSFAV